MPGSVPPMPASYRDVAGREVACRFDVVADYPPVPGSPFHERELTSLSGPLAGTSPGQTRAVQRCLVNPGEANEWTESDLLDNEIRIGIQLVRVFGEGHCYPAELSRLIGYDIDADQPFVLLEPYRGEPADRVVRRLRLDQEHSFEAGLMRAIALLEIAGVVHGRISPANTWWDSQEEVICLTDFGQASLSGEPRRGTGEAPWSSPEQMAGSGVADPRDDVWSAGQVIYYVVTGRHARGAGQPPDPSPRGAALQALLGGTFAATAAARPHGAELLAKLKVGGHWPPETATVDPLFAEGQRRFDAKRADKNRDDPDQGHGQGTGQPSAHGAPPQGSAPQGSPPNGGSPNGTPPRGTPPQGTSPRRTPPQGKPRRKGIFGWFAGATPGVIILTGILIATGGL